MTQAHSRLAPSSAHQWAFCPGAPAMQAAIPPQPELLEAREGTAAHELAQKMFSAMLAAGDGEIPPYATHKGLKAQNGLAFSQKMHQDAEKYISDAYGVILKHHRSTDEYRIQLETKVSARNLHPDCYGTPDLFYYNPRENYLLIMDYKTGHLPVEAEWNLQLFIYLVGVLNFLELHLDDVITNLNVELRIYQPNDFLSGRPAARAWWPPMSQFRRMFADLQERAQRTDETPPMTITGDHCRDCPAAYACVAFTKTTAAALDRSQRMQTLIPNGRQLAARLDEVARIAWILDRYKKALEKQAELSLRSGDFVPNYRLKPKRGRVGWSIPSEHVVSIGRAYGIDLAKDLETLTPRQAADAGIPKEALEHVTKHYPGALHLVRMSSSEIRKAFENV